MAQVKPLKFASGAMTEVDGTADDVTYLSVTAGTGGLSSSGNLSVTGTATTDWASTGNITATGNPVWNFGTGQADFGGNLDANAGLDVIGALTQVTGAVTLTANGASSLTTSAGALTLTSAAAATWSTGAGILALDGAGGVAIAGNAATISLTTTGPLDLNGAVTTLDSSSTIALTGTTTFDIDTGTTLSLNSSGGVINIGNDAVAQAINVGTGAAARIITIGNTTGASAVNFDSGTAGFSFTGDAAFEDNMTVAGNLTVTGTFTTANAETVLIADNHLYLNNGYSTAVAQTGGLVVNYLPIATTDTVAATGFVAGVVATSNPVVTTTASATFAVGQFIQISGSNNASNDGLFEVLTHVGTALTIRGIGTTATIEDFTQNQFVTDTTVAGTISRVNVSIMRAGTDGIWETAAGATTGITFDNVGTTAGSTLQAAYAAGNAIVTDSTNGPFDVSGTQVISLGATGTSDFTVASGALNLGTTTSGTVNLNGAGLVNIDGASDVAINSSGGDVGLSTDAVAQVVVVGTGAAAKAITLGNVTGATSITMNSGTGGIALNTTGVGDIVLTGSDTVLVDAVGVLELNSSGAAIGIGTDAVAQAINVGTGAAARTITVGNVTGATALALNAGTGGIALASTGTGDITMASADTVLIDSAGVLELNSSGGVISIGNDAVAQDINVGTGGAARTITVGNLTAGILDFNAGAGGITMDAGVSVGSISIGGTGGTGNILVGNAGARSIQIGSNNVTTAASLQSNGNLNIIAGASSPGVNLNSQGATAFTTATAGTNTSATGFRVRNNSLATLFEVLADGAIDTSLGTLNVPTGTSFIIGGTALTTAAFTAPNVDTLLDGSNADALHVHAAGASTGVTVDFVANGAVAAGAPVYFSGLADDAAEADASAIGTARVVGFATAVALDNAAVTVKVSGTVTNAAIEAAGTLTIGSPVYLAETAGEVTATAPITAGTVVMEVGIAYSTTAFLYQPKAPIVNS